MGLEPETDPLALIGELLRVDKIERPDHAAGARAVEVLGAAGRCAVRIQAGDLGYLK